MPPLARAFSQPPEVFRRPNFSPDLVVSSIDVKGNTYRLLTLSLLTHLIHEVLLYDKYGTASTGGYALNYGFDRLRFTGDVPAGKRIRARFLLKEVRERSPGELVQTVATQVEVEGEDDPVLFADWLFLWVTEQGHQRIVES